MTREQVSDLIMTEIGKARSLGLRSAGDVERFVQAAVPEITVLVFDFEGHLAFTYDIEDAYLVEREETED